jgi:uncharacterized membrane protein
MIDDRIEEGLDEDLAVAAIGSVDVLAAQIREDFSRINTTKKNCARRRKMKAWEIVLIALGSPIWLSLLIAAIVIIIAVYAIIWSVVVSLWSVFGALVGCAVGGLAGGVFVTIFGNAFAGILLFSVAIICAGLSIFMFFGCRETTKASAWLTRWIFVSVKNAIFKREGKQ